jgi:CelD/BcsL family acetyltransferase involved in cellulose biosynthesis
VKVCQWSEQEFAQSAAPWQELLDRSDADPLFMSWQWQWLWWRHYARVLDAELNLLAIYNSGDRLVGLAPLCLRQVRHRGGVRAARLESLGSTWRHGASAFSEYLDFIIDRDHVDAAVAALGDALQKDRRWDDLVIGYTRRDGAAARLADSAVRRAGHVRIADPLHAHVATIPESFDDYVRALDASTRRKLWNHRKKLARPALKFARIDEIDRYFDTIDSFHQSRWGARLYEGAYREFHLAFATAMSRANTLQLSRLMVGDRPLSVMYNVRLGGKEYNLQLGFDAANSAGLSPGYLHFGYSLERACADGVRQFDFLAGQGRARQYKQDFRTSGEELVCLQLIRSAPLSWAYRLYDRWKRAYAGGERDAPACAAVAEQPHG